MANRTRRTPKKDELFFAALAEGMTVIEALAASGYKRRTVYDWRRDDEAFRELWEGAFDIALERMEAEADRRGIEGIEQPIYYRGVEVEHVRKFSDALLMFRIKKLDPSYRDTAPSEEPAKDRDRIVIREVVVHLDHGRPKVPRELE